MTALTRPSHSDGYKGRVRVATPRLLAALLAGAALVGAIAASSVSAGSPAAASAAANACTLVRLRPAPTASQARLARAMPFAAGWADHGVDRRGRGRPGLRLAPARATPEIWAEFIVGLMHGPEISLPHDVRRHARRGAGDLRQSCARLLLGEPDDRPGRGGHRRDDPGRGHPPRVRAPRRVQPGQHPLGGRRLGAQELGERRERLRASRPQGGLPWRRGLELRAQPRRGVGGDLPAHGRAQGRDHDRDLADHRAELLSDRRGACWLRSATSSSPGRRRRTTGYSRQFAKSTKVWWIPLATPLDGELRIARRCRRAVSTTSRSWRRIARPCSGARSGSRSGSSASRPRSAARAPRSSA